MFLKFNLIHLFSIIFILIIGPFSEKGFSQIESGVNTFVIIADGFGNNATSDDFSFLKGVWKSEVKPNPAYDSPAWRKFSRETGIPLPKDESNLKTKVSSVLVATTANFKLAIGDTDWNDKSSEFRTSTTIWTPTLFDNNLFLNCDHQLGKEVFLIRKFPKTGNVGFFTLKYDFFLDAANARKITASTPKNVIGEGLVVTNDDRLRKLLLNEDVREWTNPNPIRELVSDFGHGSDSD